MQKSPWAHPEQNFQAGPVCCDVVRQPMRITHVPTRREPVEKQILLDEDPISEKDFKLDLLGFFLLEDVIDRAQDAGLGRAAELLGALQGSAKRARGERAA